MEDAYPITDLREALDVSRAGFYCWRQREPSERERAEADLGAQIDTFFARSRRTYGSPRLHRALRRAGHACGRHRVARIMRGRGIVGRVRGRRRPGTTDSDHLRPIAPNRLGQREAPVERPNEVWAADITYVPTGGGWLYLAGMLDLGQPPGGGPGDGREPGHEPADGRATDGVTPVPAQGRVAPTLGSGKPVRQRGVPRA